MQHSSKVRRNPDVLFSELGEKTMMMSMKSGNYHELDRTGSLVWKEIEHSVEIEALQARFSARYDVPRDQCLSDLMEFLGELSELDLIVMES